MKLNFGSKEQTVEQTDPAAFFTVRERRYEFANLTYSLAEIRKLKGVTGYILRDNASAIVDLSENDKVAAYALLSSEIHESSGEIAKHLNFVNVESVLVQGNKSKVLCLILGENRIGIFMDKTASHTWILKRILLS